MWRLPVYCLLLVALASSEPQGYNYLPPSGSGPSSVICQPAVTSVSFVNSISTSVVRRTINQVDTIFKTTTVVQRQVVPTTIYSTRVQTQTHFETSIVQSTANLIIERVIDQTITRPNVVRTQHVISTRVVPHVSYVTREHVQTQVVPVEVTRTAVHTVEKTNYSYQTQLVQRTNVVTSSGREVIQTRLRTVVHTSVVQRTLPGRTNIITSTRVQQVINTRTVQGINQIRTSVVQRTQVIPTTIVSRRVENKAVTRTNVVTRTITTHQTNYKTQVVPQEVVSTRVVSTTRFTTLYVTQAQPVNKVKTHTNYRTVAPNPVVETREVTQTTVQQVQGVNGVIEREVVQTQHRQQVVYKTVNRAQDITATRTITSYCSGYNYNSPGKPFVF